MRSRSSTLVERGADPALLEHLPSYASVLESLRVRGTAPDNTPRLDRHAARSAMPIFVRQDDLTAADVQALVSEHLAGMHGNTPAGHVHALAVESLRAPGITFWSAWSDGLLCGCGALKSLGECAGEVKSMRTRPRFLRRGVGQAILNEIIRAARDRGYRQLYLETGTGDAFAAAHALYLRNGFEWCGPFGDYIATDFNVFMVKALPAACPV